MNTDFKTFCENTKEIIFVYYKKGYNLNVFELAANDGQNYFRSPKFYFSDAVIRKLKKNKLKLEMVNHKMLDSTKFEKIYFSVMSLNKSKKNIRKRLNRILKYAI